MVTSRWQAFTSSLVSPRSSGPKTIATRLCCRSYQLGRRAAQRHDDAAIQSRAADRADRQSIIGESRSEVASIVEAVSTSPPCTAIEVAARSSADATGATRRRSVNPMFLSARDRPEIAGLRRAAENEPDSVSEVRRHKHLNYNRDSGLGKVTTRRETLSGHLSCSPLRSSHQ